MCCLVQCVCVAQHYQIVYASLFRNTKQSLVEGCLDLLIQDIQQNYLHSVASMKYKRKCAVLIKVSGYTATIFRCLYVDCLCVMCIDITLCCNSCKKLRTVVSSYVRVQCPELPIRTQLHIVFHTICRGFQLIIFILVVIGTN